MTKLFATALALALAATPALAQVPTTPAAPAAGAIQRFGFLALNVADMDRSLAFYKGLGLVERFRHEDAGVLEVGLGAVGQPQGSELLLVRRKPAAGQTGAGGGFSRVAYMVTDLEALAARLKAEGRQVRDPVVAAAAKVRVAFVTDPDGYAVELIEPIP